MNVTDISQVIKQPGVIPISSRWTTAEREAAGTRLTVAALRRRLWPAEQRIRAERLADQWRARA